MRTFRRSLTAVTAALLVLVGACTSAVEGTASSSSADGATGGATAGGTAGALTLVPASAGSADVMDLASAKQRWGFATVTSETAESPEADEFRSKLAATGLGSSLLTYESLFAGAGWSGLDVELEITAQADGPPVTVYRLRSTLDMQTVIDSLAADGMQRSGSDEAPFFRAESLGTGKFGRVFLSGVTVYPAQHLVVGGPQGSWSLPDAGASLADAPGVPALLADLPSAGYLAIDTGAQACAVLPLGGTASAESSRRYLATLEAAGERRPVTASLIAATADDAGEIRTGYADEAAAAADLPVRTKILQTVDSAVSRQPYSGLLTATITQTGASLRYAIQEERPAALIRMRQQRDTPWAFC